MYSQSLKLPREEDKSTTYQEIKEGIIFRDYNLWLLIVSIGIACVGLNINNPSGVIGSMPSSPLMAAIVGLSFGLSIQDKGLVKLSLY